MAKQKKKRERGRPPGKRFGAGKFYRLTNDLEQAIEDRRQQMEREAGEPVDASKAARDLLRAGAIAKGLLAPSSNGQS